MQGTPGPTAADLAEVLAEVRRIEVQARRLVTGVMAGGYLSVFRGSGLEFETVREYAEGDPQRAVDWNVTARMGRPFVKTYVDERELTMVFLLDLSPSMGAGFGAWSARQVAARVCASLGISAVRNGDRVGLVAFGREVDAFVRPRKGGRHALRIVRDCLAHPFAEGETSLAAPLEFASHAVRRHAIVFLISDFLSYGWERPLQVCARRHDVIAVRLLSPELSGARGGLARVRDPETGREDWIDFAHGPTRRAYEARVAAWRAHTERVLARARVDRIDIAIPRERDREVVPRALLRFFRMRELRGRKR